MKAWLLAALVFPAAQLLADSQAFEDSFRQYSLQMFHPSYLAMDSDHGEARIQFLLSFKYLAVPLGDFNWKLGGYRLNGLNFAYDGLYDFYFVTRYSQPVISRLQNPGFYFSLSAPEKERAWDMDSLRLGWFHESNGQVVGRKADYDEDVSRVGSTATDYVSRAWDYWYLSSDFSTFPQDKLRLSFSPTLRVFTGKGGIIAGAEQDIFWRPQDPPKAISDYDGLRGSFSAEWQLPMRALNYVGLSAEFRTGYHSGSFASNWSRRFTLSFKTWYLPWYLYYNSGYGPYISDYTTWSEGYGIGIRFW